MFRTGVNWLGTLALTVLPVKLSFLLVAEYYVPPPRSAGGGPLYALPSHTEG